MRLLERARKHVCLPSSCAERESADASRPCFGSSPRQHDLFVNGRRGHVRPNRSCSLMPVVPTASPVVHARNAGQGMQGMHDGVDCNIQKT